MEKIMGLFLILLNMSVTATIVAIVIILVRGLILKRVPKSFSYVLWVVLLFRLISPFSISSSLSFMNIINPPTQENTVVFEYIPRNFTSINRSQVDMGIDTINNSVNTVLTEAVNTASVNPMEIILFISTIIWLIGIVGFIVYSIIGYKKVLNKVSTSVIYKAQIVEDIKTKLNFNRNIKVYKSDQIESPFVIGFVTPKVYLPTFIKDSEIPYVLMHEFIHIKRFDYLIKPLSYLILIFHWFNPVMWISYSLMSKDMEMSCDERVMGILGDEIKYDYSNSLLSMALKENILLNGSPLSFGESNVKSRIKNILKFKKPTFYALVAAVILVGTIGFILLANPNKEYDREANGLNYKEIYHYKTPYVGNGSKVSNLVSNLYYWEYKKGISLETKERPYKVTVKYSKIEEYFSHGDTVLITDKILKNASIMFCLIDNVDEIYFSFDDKDGPYIFSLKREHINQIFGQDIRKYSSSFNRFRNEFIPVLERDNWDDFGSEVYITNKVELYVWRNKNITGTDDIFYTLLPGTNKSKDNNEIYDLDLATTDIKVINEKLSEMQGITHLSIKHDSSFSKQDITEIGNSINFKGEGISIGGFGEGFISDSFSNIGIKVEKLLKEIMSSPLESSNPYDYIKAHKDEYEAIVKMGDEALKYMLSLFEKGEDESLKAHIMMSLCIDILGDRNNVEEGSYTSPREWYLKLFPYKAIKLPPFKYESKDKIETMVYEAAIKKYSQRTGADDETITIVAPKIFGTYETDKELKIFVTVYYNHFKLYGKILHNYSGGVIPGAIVYTKNDDGSYSLKEYIEPMHGAYFRKSIEEFCEPRKDIAEEILKHYSNYENLFILMKNNIVNYLEENNLKGIRLKKNTGEIILLN